MQNTSENHVHKITNVPVLNGAWTEWFCWGQYITRALGMGFRALKSLDFQGPPLPRALKMDLPTSKLVCPAPYKQQVNYRLS
jgi:hypothetical protein